MRGKRVDLGAYEYNVRSGTLMILRQNGTTATAGVCLSRYLVESFVANFVECGRASGRVVSDWEK